MLTGYPATYGSAEGSLPGPDIPPNTPLEMNTPLYPFTKPDRSHYTSVDVTNIEGQLEYTYGPIPLDVFKLHTPSETEGVSSMKGVYNINPGNCLGSFVAGTYAKRPDGTKIDVGWDAEPLGG